MRVAFAGTPAFAAAALQAIVDAGHAVPLVLTQPDRPAGRGMKLQPSAVKQMALQRGLPLAQPQGLRLDGRHVADAQAAQHALAGAAPDVMLVAAYGLLLPPWVLGLPRHGCINLHASLLPRWRGAAPVQRAIEAGDAQTGITLMQMDAGLDTGPMLAAEATPIDADDTAATLLERLAAIGARLAVAGLDALAAGTLAARPQPDEGACHAPKIQKAEAAIDWAAPAASIERRLRAFDPFPGCTFEDDGRTLKLWRGRVAEVDAPHGAAPGMRLPASDGRWFVACGDGGREVLEVLEVQWPGGRRLPAREAGVQRSSH